jgi:hypothetical protein
LGGSSLQLWEQASVGRALRSIQRKSEGRRKKKTSLKSLTFDDTCSGHLTLGGVISLQSLAFGNDRGLNYGNSTREAIRFY